MHGRERWSPGIPSNVSRLIILALAIQAVIRGFDYLLGDRTTTTSALAVAEEALPLPVWGAIFIVGGSLVLVGLRVRRAGWIVSGSVWLFAAYGAVGWSLVLRIFEQATSWGLFWGVFSHPHLTLQWASQSAEAFPLDGWRVPSSFFAAMVMWAAIGWGTQISSRAWEVTHGSDHRAAS
ncbi:hypothetical protein [Corynebacterium heidelbergense]|uniref:Uncharacterized protein n=1 Tax=Corynebacterium heidelbergense TaxID=2055947 RepID=A0A364VE64_9CORY|nr:hypothetical protein [Corynebacterium heidelbergense]RAV34937.1 hypothetical protein CWC39_00950 [Corynebacterium heidelbergense]WCZ36076.1 hypothetical protein CHEID_02550 [Corynebacterium heidelbergense]